MQEICRWYRIFMQLKYVHVCKKYVDNMLNYVEYMFTLHKVVHENIESTRHLSWIYYRI